ncbi:DUF86 domain-containing protein [Candidatus Poribacteria bacterium]|nr:DUF86 domain-containing protein [Candidatus Poribacteria bacterium]
MKKDDTVFLKHILDSIKLIEIYLDDISFKRFLQEKLIQDGVIHELEIVGEASRNLSDEFRKSYPEIPWSQIISLRNRIAHVYFNINLQIIWEITQNDIPYLRSKIEYILGTG